MGHVGPPESCYLLLAGQALSNLDNMQMQSRSKRLSASRKFRWTLLCTLACCCTWNFFRVGRDASVVEHEGNAPDSLFTLLMVPKPGFDSVIPSGLLEWKNQLALVGGEVVLLLNEYHDIHLARAQGFKTEHVEESENGFPLLHSILRVAAKHRSSKMIAFCNSDILPGNHFSKRIKALAQLDIDLELRYVDDLIVQPTGQVSKAWLVVLSRIDFVRYRGDGHVFMDGGVDMWIWNNVPRDNDICGAGIDVPAFRIGRPWFDNWVTAAAMQLGGRHVIDGTNKIEIFHKVHKRLGNLSDWSSVKRLENDIEWRENKKFAYEPLCARNGRCVNYRLGIGTTCEAPLYLAGTQQHLLVKERQDLIPCPSCNDCYAH